jgi:hypothetical protein
VSRRALIAAGVMTLWLGGMAALAHRELFSGEADRLARAALFVAPGADYYEISDGTRQIGFGSSTIDTTQSQILISDLVVADLPSAAGGRRLAARSSVELTRGLRLQRFRYELGGDASQSYLAVGTVQGDTLLTLITTRLKARPDTQHVRLPGPLLLPTMVPMAIALGEKPKVGDQYRYQIFDPLADSTRSVAIRVRAESLFVLPDSATFDPATRQWVMAHQDTVRSWRIEQQDGALLTGWIDGQGRMVQAEPFARFAMRRTAYELAFENWSRDGKPSPSSLSSPPAAGPSSTLTTP